MGKPELALYAKEDGTGRAYKHPFRLAKDEKPLTSPSVTTVLNLVDKPALIQWAADRTLDWAIENVSLLFVKDRESAIRWGKYRWTDARNERAEVGTGIHEMIEAIHTGAWNFPVLDDEQVRIMKQWDKLNERYEITPHRSEFSVWKFDSKTNRDYAGTADGLWDIVDRETGESWSNVIIDLKTSKNIWPEHWLQLAALQRADVIMNKLPDGTWEELPMPESDGTAIIHLREDKFQVLIESDQNLIDLQFQRFSSYRDAWHFQREISEFTKERDGTKAMKF